MKYGFLKQGKFIYYVLGQEDPETEKYGFAVIDFSTPTLSFLNNIPFLGGTKPTKSDFKRISNRVRKMTINLIFERL